MTDTRKAQLEIGVNAAPAEEGFKRVERAGKGMADAVGKLGTEASKGVDSIGKGADASAQKLDKATSSIIASVQRTTAAMQAGEKGTAKYFEELANQRGVNADVLKPYLDGLRAVEQAQGRVGISAKQTAAAMRGVPAQFTDIVTSLQGGQAPLTVLLQQGGQLKDMFGGIGNAARALGGYVAGLVNPFTVAAAAGGVLAVAYAQGSKEADEFRKALVLSGNAAGASVGQLSALAESIGSGFGKNVGQAAAALTVLAASGGVGRASLKDFATTAIDAEKAFGIAAKDIAKNFADLAKDPLGASVKLNESMNYLTESTYKQIKAAQDLGQESKAAALAQDAYNSALKGRSAEVLQSAGTIEKAWAGIKSAATGAWDAMLGVGRPVTVASQLDLAQKNLEAAVAKRKKVNDDSAFAPALDKEIAKLKEQISYVGELDRMTKRAGDSAAEQTRQTKARIEADKDGLKYLSEQQKMQRDIAQQVASLRTAKASEAEIEERIAQIKASYAKKGDKDKEISDYEKLNRRIGDFAALQEAASQSQGKLTEGQRLSVKIAEDMAAAGVKLSAAEKQRLQTMLDAAVATEQRNIIDKETNKFMEDSIKLQAAAVAQSEKSTTSIRQQALAEREAMASIGLTKEAIAELTAAKYDDSAASKERLANIMAEAGEPELLIKKYREEAQALRDLANAKRERGAAEMGEEIRKASEKAADETRRQWERTADNIERSLTDSLMRGFEAGKGFAENLRDTLKNMFNTLVLRPVIQAVVGGVLGLGGSGASASGGASTISSLGQLKDLYSAGSAIASVGGQFLAGTMSSANAAGTIGANITGTGIDGLLASNGAYGTAGSSAATIGSAATLVGGALVGFMAGKMISGGYSAIGKSGNTSVAAGTAIGAVLGGPIGAAIGGAVGGLVNRAFGRKAPQVTGEGIEGTFSTSGADVRSFQTWFAKGGWFRSNKSGTNYSAVSSEVDQTLDQALVGVSNATRTYAQYLGLSTSAIEGYSKRINISLRGLDAAGQEKAVGDAIASFGNDLAERLLGSSGPNTIRQGETASQALQRLGDSLANVNLVLSTLNTTLLSTSLYGADAASSLLDVFGGLEKFQASTSAYYEAFYSEAERNTKTMQAVSTSIRAMGFAVPTTIKGFRDLVSAQNLTTDSGRATYAALVQLAPAFAEVTRSAQDSFAAYQEAFYSPAELQASKLSGLKKVFDDIGLTVQEGTKTIDSFRIRMQRGWRGMFRIENIKLEVPNLVAKSLPTTLEEYRKLVEAQDQNTEAGKRAYAMLIDLAPEFADFVKAQEDLREAIKATADTALEEARRLRGQTTETGSEAFLQTQFAILTGQARAGDITALEKLPSVTQAIERAARTSATSSVEFERIKALLATSLETTVAALGLGSTAPAASANLPTVQDAALSAINQNSLASSFLNPATAELVAAPAVSLATMAASSGTAAEQQKALVTEVRALREQVAILLVTAQATAVSSDKTARTFDLVTQGTGTVMVTSV